MNRKLALVSLFTALAVAVGTPVWAQSVRMAGQVTANGRVEQLLLFPINDGGEVIGEPIQVEVNASSQFEKEIPEGRYSMTHHPPCVTVSAVSVLDGGGEVQLVAVGTDEAARLAPGTTFSVTGSVVRLSPTLKFGEFSAVWSSNKFTSIQTSPLPATPPIPGNALSAMSSKNSALDPKSTVSFTRSTPIPSMSNLTGMESRPPLQLSSMTNHAAGGAEFHAALPCSSGDSVGEVGER